MTLCLNSAHAMDDEAWNCDTNSLRSKGPAKRSKIFIQHRVERACLTVYPPHSTLHLNGFPCLIKIKHLHPTFCLQTFDRLATSSNKESSSRKKQPIRKRICGRAGHNFSGNTQKVYCGFTLLDQTSFSRLATPVLCATKTMLDEIDWSFSRGLRMHNNN